MALKKSVSAIRCEEIKLSGVRCSNYSWDICQCCGKRLCRMHKHGGRKNGRLE
jgi:hypothetical protein